ncbi:hypothetical protein D3C85_1858120 [compost metagenome]
MSGVLASMASRMAAGITPFSASVNVGPGATALTRICGAKSWASRRVRWLRAALAVP